MNQGHAQVPFHVMVKPIGPRCNLRCTYCFYLEKQAFFPGDETYRMSDKTLEQFIRTYTESQATREVTFAWQGGEPALLGVDFFRRAVAYERQYAGPHRVSNSFQTNGTLLDDEWCEFLAQERFLVGLSLDGPEDVHDRKRVYADGRGSFKDVMRGLELLKKHGVDFNTLTCVYRENACDGDRVYRFLRECGVQFVQFIPIVERLPDAAAAKRGLDLAMPPGPEAVSAEPDIAPFAVEPRPWGQFLVDVFDRWVRKDVGRIFVNHFDLALSAWNGMDPPLCVYSKLCGNALAMEHDGGVYACDHYVYPEYRRGNIMEDPWTDMAHAPAQQAFGNSKWLELPGCCRQCAYLRACHGGCLKHRFAASPDGEACLNYLCEGYKLFFAHVEPYMERMVRLLRERRAPAEIMRELPSRSDAAVRIPRKKQKKRRGKKRA